MIISRLLKYNFKKTTEKCDSNSKVYKAQEVNKPQLVLVHHLRFYGTKRSSRHQDGTMDKVMTQTSSLKPSFHSTLLFNHTKHSHENKLQRFLKKTHVTFSNSRNQSKHQPNMHARHVRSSQDKQLPTMVGLTWLARWHNIDTALSMQLVGKF